VGTENADQQTKESADPKTITAEELITDWPLYVPATIFGFRPPKQISFYCSGDCGKETTWVQVYPPTHMSADERDGNIEATAYTCGLCYKTNLTVIYRDMNAATRVVMRAVRGSSAYTAMPVQEHKFIIMKVGQYPAQSVSLPNGLEKNLGPEAAGLYRKGLISRNNGYGLGALIYIRRVVEDKTNELIEVAATLSESYNIDAAVIAKMREAAKSEPFTPYEEKLRIAATVFPDSLKVGSVNPLGSLYTLVSKGIHGLTENECIDAFDTTVEVFDYIFTNLRTQVADRRSFVERVKKLR
jgi:hypothetical protein